MSVWIIISIFTLADFRYYQIYLFLYWSKKCYPTKLEFAKKNSNETVFFVCKKKTLTYLYLYFGLKIVLFFSYLEILQIIRLQSPQVGNKLWQCKLVKFKRTDIRTDKGEGASLFTCQYITCDMSVQCNAMQKSSIV